MLNAFVELVAHPIVLFRLAASRLLWPWRLRCQKGLHIEGRIRVNGMPLIDIRDGARIHIAESVTLNSWNRGSHVNLYAPVKLFAEGHGTEIHIGRNTRIHGSCLHARSRICIGENCLIAGNAQIFDCSGHDLSFQAVDSRLQSMGESKPITIEDAVWIGTQVIVLPGVTIGRGSVVGAGSVVVRDVPPFVVVAGNPALIVTDFRHLLGRDDSMLLPEGITEARKAAEVGKL
jgi:acetyltransferase-like isoleucine patch superfamily enzyme